MNIAIMSDTHDNWPNLKKAIEIANQHGCEVLLHAGDLIAPTGIIELRKFNGNVKYIWGNNEGEKIGITHAIESSLNIKVLGDILDEKVAGLKTLMNHYPEIGRLAYKTGEYDLVVYGHDHNYNVEKNDATLLINPGEVCGYLTGRATFIIFNSESMEVKRIDL